MSNIADPTTPLSGETVMIGSSCARGIVMAMESNKLVIIKSRKKAWRISLSFVYWIKHSLIVNEIHKQYINNHGLLTSYTGSMSMLNILISDSTHRDKVNV